MVTGNKVEVIVYRRKGEHVEYLILKTNGKGDFWQPVTGNVEENDSSLKEAAKREFQEETGMNFLNLSDELYSFKYKASQENKEKFGIGEFQEHVFAVEVDWDETVEIGKEHKDFIWCIYEGARELLKFDTNKTALDKVNEFILSN